MLYSQISPVLLAFWTTWNALTEDKRIGIVCWITMFEVVTVVPLCIFNLGTVGGPVALLIVLVPFALFMAGVFRRQMRIREELTTRMRGR